MTTTTPAEGSTATFADLGVAPELCEPLVDIGIVNPFPIQEITLPLALSGADVIGQARTGTGKTLAFGLPLLQRIEPGERRTVALVVVPTRELCLQVRDDLAQVAGRKSIEVLAVYGGRSLDPQIEALRKGVPVVVGTPGRLLDLQQRGVLDLSGVTSLVLDEADEMLDLGFLPDVERLIESTSPQRQTMLFSATMPSAVVALARRYMSKPTFLRADVEESRIAPETRQHFFSCHRMDKPAVLARILQAPERGLCVVFTRTKRMADILASELHERGIAAAPIHSDLRQESRERALKRFRQGKTDVLVATEVAARGLDIDDVTHVVNYDCPDDEKMYLHRIGRTGRAGAAGVAITLAVWNELARVEMIKRALDIDEPTHEVFSTSEILDDLFDLPPRSSRPAPSAADWDRAVNRGSSRSRGRGRSGASSNGGGDAQASERRPAAQPDARAGERGGDAEAAGEDAARRRVRRRKRDSGRQTGPAGASASGTPAGAPATSGPAQGAPAAGAQATGARATDAEAVTEPAGRSATRDGQPTVRRVRRRGRGGPDERAGEVAGGRKPGQDAPQAGDRSRAGRPGGGQRRPKSRERAREESGSRSGPRSGGGRQRSGGSSGASAGEGQRSGGRGRRRSGERRGSDRPAAGAGASEGTRAIDSDAARGEGKPRLRRPLEVAHLP